MIRQLADELTTQQRQTSWTNIRRAYPTLGDNSFTLIVPNGQPKEIYLRDADTNATIVAYLPPNFPSIMYRDGDSSNATIEVRVGYPPGSTQYTVMDNLTLAGQQAVGTLSNVEAFNYEAWWAQLNQITPLRARCTDPVSASVAVDGPLSPIQPSSGLPNNITTLTYSFTTLIAALTSGQHQFVKLYYDKEALVLYVQAQTAVTAASSLPSRSEFSADDLAGFTTDSTWIDIIPIYLYYGQTEIAEADFYRTLDLRPLFSGSGSGSTVEKILTFPTGLVAIDANGYVMTRV